MKLVKPTFPDYKSEMLAVCLSVCLLSSVLLSFARS